MQNIIETNVCSPLTSTIRWLIMVWSPSAVQDTGEYQHCQDLTCSLAMFCNTTHENRTQFIMTKLALSQLSPQTSFLNKFHARMATNIHDAPVRPHQTKVCVTIGDLTNPCLLANSSWWSMGRAGKKNILEENGAALQGAGKHGKPNQDQTHLILKEGPGYAEHITFFPHFSV